MRVMELLARYPGHQETTAALRVALDLADMGDPGPEKIESLGGGWIAEEALAIGVSCALEAGAPGQRGAVQDSAIGDDTDSTGSVCGNLLGAHHGDSRLPLPWLARTEGRAVIAEIADDFSFAFHGSGAMSAGHLGQVLPLDRYPRN